MTEYLPVFVYGTLRNGHHNYKSILKGNTVKEVSASMNGTLYMVTGFPGMIDGNDRVIGELMYIDPKKFEETLQRLDWLEGYNEKDKYSFYLRKQCMVWSDGGSVKAWTYYYNRSTKKLPLIINGDFTEYVKNVRQV